MAKMHDWGFVGYITKNRMIQQCRRCGAIREVIISSGKKLGAELNGKSQSYCPIINKPKE